MVHNRWKAGWELLSLSLFLNAFKYEIDSLKMDCYPQKGPGKSTSSMWNILCGKSTFFSLLISYSLDGLRIFFLITGQIISFNIVGSNSPSYVCHVASHGAALVFVFQKSTLCWIKLPSWLQWAVWQLLNQTWPKCCFAHFTCGPFSLPCPWVWCQSLDDVLHQKVLMYSSPWHMLWSCKVTCCSSSFSGVQGRENEAPAISMCDSWWSAPR